MPRPITATVVFILISGFQLPQAGCAPAPAPVEVAAGFDITEGEIEGALFSFAEPANWNGKALILAHGYRPDDAPLLAVLDTAEPFVAGLLADGWLIAATSYRRNGLVFFEAAGDLNNLMAHIVRTLGRTPTFFVEGSSLGANVAVLLAEREGNRDPRIRRMFGVSGVVAIGADLEAPLPGGPHDWTLEPGIPMLLAANRSEAASPAGYVDWAAGHHPAPVLGLLDRDGHVNINSTERRAALDMVGEWAFTGKIPTGPVDLTFDMSERRSTAVRYEKGLKGTILSVDPIYGNLDTSIVARDLDLIGHEPGDLLLLQVGRWRGGLPLSTTYADVEPGSLVAFFTAEGILRLAANLDNARDRIDCAAGDEIRLLEHTVERTGK